MGFFNILGKIVGGAVEHLEKEANKPENIAKFEAKNEASRLKGLSSEERISEQKNRKDRLASNKYGHGEDARIDRNIDKKLDKAYSDSKLYQNDKK
jgi:putative cell wall-binding protein